MQTLDLDDITLNRDEFEKIAGAGYFLLDGQLARQLLALKAEVLSETRTLLTREEAFFDKWESGKSGQEVIQYWNRRSWGEKASQISWNFHAERPAPIELPRAHEFYHLCRRVIGCLLSMMLQWYNIGGEKCLTDRERLDNCMYLYYYPPASKYQGLEEHTDNELFTLIATNAPGLEVSAGADKWEDISPEGILVMFGDAAEKYGLKAPLHRVRRIEEEKTTVVYFV